MRIRTNYWKEENVDVWRHRTERETIFWSFVLLGIFMYLLITDRLTGIIGVILLFLFIRNQIVLVSKNRYRKETREESENGKENKTR